MTDPAAVTPRLILVDVTATSEDPTNTGVQRVTRQLSRLLQQRADLALGFVRWNAREQAYRLLEPRQRAGLAAFSGPIDSFALLASALGFEVDRLMAALSRSTSTPSMLFPEIPLTDFHARVSWAEARDMESAALLYDLIPIDFPHYCAPAVSAAFPGYLNAALRCTQLFCISDYASQCVQSFMRATGARRTTVLKTQLLPGQFGEAQRVLTPLRPGLGDEIGILCVATLEPRKNHAALFAAWRALRARRPDLPIRLTLVGRSWAEFPQIPEEAGRLAAADSAFNYAGVLSDAELQAAFAESAFAVYPSLVEGFGLPILESLWLGRPCVVHSEGVMAELAGPGGCLRVDMRDSHALSLALERLAAERGLRDQLTREAMERPIDRWDDYAAAIAAHLAYASRQPG